LLRWVEHSKCRVGPYNGLVALWHPFDPSKREYEFNEEKLAEHGVAVHEAAEVFWNGFEVRRDKSYKSRYQVLGRTDAGRTLKLIVHRAGRRLRVITGWPL